jgi:hypothetical protein
MYVCVALPPLPPPTHTHAHTPPPPPIPLLQHQLCAYLPTLHRPACPPASPQVICLGSPAPPRLVEWGTPRCLPALDVLLGCCFVQPPTDAGAHQMYKAARIVTVSGSECWLGGRPARPPPNLRSKCDRLPFPVAAVGCPGLAAAWLNAPRIGGVSCPPPARPPFLARLHPLPPYTPHSSQAFGCVQAYHGPAPEGNARLECAANLP